MSCLSAYGRIHATLRRPALPLAAGLAAASAAPTVMAQEAVSLSPVVVTAAGYEQNLKDAPASITVISREELQQKRYSSVAEAVSNIEGVDVDGSVGKTGGREISMRGMPSDYTLVLIDGRRQNTAGDVTPNGFGSTQTSFMPPPSAIERIEVIRGPMSTLYGSDAMGGVINIITRKVQSEWGGSLTLENTLQEESEFGDSSGASLYASGPLIQEHLGLVVRARTHDRQGSDISYTEADGTEVTPWMGGNPVESDIRNLGGRLNWRLNDTQDLFLDADHTRQRYDNSSGQLGTLGAGGYDEEQRYSRTQYTLGHEARFGFGDLSSSVMHNTTETEGRLIPPGTPGKVGGADRELETDNLVFDTKLVAPVGDHMLSLGGQWWEAEMVDGVVSEEFEQTMWALFVEDEWLLHERVALTLGARYDDHSSYGDQLSPRMYLVWNATDQWTFKGGVSRGYKVPRLDQLTPGIRGYGRQGTLPLVGSPELEPETSTSSELGALFERGRFRAGATLFYNQFDDKIASGPEVPNCTYAANPNQPGCLNVGNYPAVDAFGQSINIDEAVTYGAELHASMPLAERWTLSANYTYTESEQKSGPNDGDPLTDTPRHSVNAELRWHTTAKLATWLRGEYRSERYRAPGRGGSTAAREGLGDYKAYGLLHLGGAYTLSPNVTLNAAIYNLTNENFIDYRPYQDGGSTEYDNVYNNNLEGRRFWLSANINF